MSRYFLTLPPKYCIIVVIYFFKGEKPMFSLNGGGIFGWLFDANTGVYKGVSELKYYLFYFLFMIVMIAVAYLLGSLNSAIIVSRVLYRDDVRKHGSGNAGLTNTLRTYGKNAALLTLFGDIMKTIVAIFIGGVLFGFGYIAAISTSEMCYVAGLFAVFGHIFPVYYKFKGGKGVLATSTMALVLSPLILLGLFLLFAIIVAISKYVSLGSVTGAFIYPIIVHSYFRLAFGVPPLGIISVSTVILAVTIIWCHRENLKRIGERTERKLSFKKKPEVTKTAKENDGK